MPSPPQLSIVHRLELYWSAVLLRFRTITDVSTPEWSEIERLFRWRSCEHDLVPGALGVWHVGVWHVRFTGEPVEIQIADHSSLVLIRPSTNTNAVLAQSITARPAGTQSP